MSHYCADGAVASSLRDAADAAAVNWYLRGLAALSVLVTHALQWPLAEMNIVLLKTGRLGVDVFFVISGFIITTIAGDGRFDPKQFLVRRAFRIVPAYWAATFLITILAIAIPTQLRTTIPTTEGLIRTWASNGPGESGSSRAGCSGAIRPPTPARAICCSIKASPQGPNGRRAADRAGFKFPRRRKPARRGARVLGAIAAESKFPDVKSRLPRLRVRPLHRWSRTG